MRITVTFREMMDSGKWRKFCDITGTNEWALNEGLADDNDTVDLSEDQARELGLLPEKD